MKPPGSNCPSRSIGRSFETNLIGESVATRFTGQARLEAQAATGEALTPLFTFPAPRIKTQAHQEPIIHATPMPPLQKACCARLAMGLSQDQMPAVLMRHSVLPSDSLHTARLYRVLLLQPGLPQGAPVPVLPRPWNIRLLNGPWLVALAWWKLYAGRFTSCITRHRKSISELTAAP